MFSDRAGRKVGASLLGLVMLATLGVPGAASACWIDYPNNSQVDQRDELAKDLAFKFRQNIGSIADSDARKIVQVNRRFFEEFTQYPELDLRTVDSQVGNVATILLFKDGVVKLAIYGHSKVEGFAFSHVATNGTQVGFSEHAYQHPDRFPAWATSANPNRPHSEPIALDLLYEHIDQNGGLGGTGWSNFFDNYDELRLFTERPPCATHCVNLVDNLRSEIKGQAESLGRSGQFGFGVSHNYDGNGVHLNMEGSQQRFSRLYGALKWVNQTASNPSSGLTRMNTHPN